MSGIVELLDHVVQRTAVTRKPGAIGTKSGFGSRPPIDLDALELRDRLNAAAGAEYVELEWLALERVEGWAHVPLGLCACGTPVSCAYFRVSAQCGSCGDWLSRADAVHAAREYVETTWLTAAEIEQETRTWGTPVTAGRVRNWRYRGQISADEHGRYLLGDVLVMLAVLDRQVDAA
jgi:hypothetical protein